MPNTARLRLLLHGAIVLLMGLLCGLPTTIEAMSESARFWHTAHEALIMMGYGFSIALIMGGVLGISPFEPGHTPVAFIAFLAATTGILGAVLATALTIMGARAALKSGGSQA